MDFQQSIEAVEKILNDYPKEIQNFHSLIKTHIELLTENKEVPYFDLELCKRNIRWLVGLVIEGNTSNKYGEFLEGFSELIFNWNNNLMRNDEINLYCQCMRTLLAFSSVSSKTLDIMKQTLEQLYLYKGWLPPAYDISIPYLNTLLDENEGKKCELLDMTTKKE